MSETKTETNAPKGRPWLKWLTWVVGLLIVLVLVVYFVATSSAFFQGVVLPKASTAIGAEVSVRDAEISPFSKIVLRDLKVKPKNGEPIFTAASVSARYSLMSILRGKILVDEAAVESPTVTVVENADGTSNLDSLLKSEKPQAEKKPAPSPSAEPSTPPSVDVKSVLLKNATVRYVKNSPGGGREAVELSNVNFTLSNIKNGETGKLDVSAAIGLDKTAGVTGSNTTLQAKLNGSFTFALSQDLNPGAVKGNTTFHVEKASGDFADIASLTAKLDCDVSPTEIKQLALAFTKAGAALGQVSVSGPFDSAKMEGKLKMEVTSLDRQVLNLAGAASGIDFGATTINTSNEIELTKGGAVITAAGTVNVARFQVTRKNQTSPTLDVRCDYSVAVNRQEQSVLVKTLNLSGTQDQRPLLKTELTSPMVFAWGNSSQSVGDAALNLTVTGLNLADWKAFAGDSAPTGIANMKLKLLSQQAGKQLTFDLDAKVDQLSARVGSDSIPPVDLHLVTRGSGTDMKQFSLSECKLDVMQQGQAALSVSSTGTFNQATQDADLQLTVQAALPRLTTLMPQKDVAISAGRLDVTSHVTSKQTTRTVTGQLALVDVTGRYGEYRLDAFGTTIDLDLLMKGQQLEIRKAVGQLRQGQSAGGTFDVSGNYDLAKKAGQIALKLSDFKENDLRPFLQPSLGARKLVSVLLTTTASAGFTANGDATIKADVQLANLVVQDPQNQLPAKPLELRLLVDAGAANKVATVRQCQIGLTPTARAKNELRLTGTVDYSMAEAITGHLKLASDAFDATAYYDLFAEKEAGAAESQPPSPPPSQPTASTSAAAQKEPDAVTLPVRNFTFDVAIGHFYLREVDIANLQTTAKLDGGHVLLKPCQLTLNGAPVNATADLDLGVPGYKYDVAFNADKVPLAPLVNSFSPAYANKAKGDFVATFQVKGAGTTGRNLRESLGGQINLSITNANIEIAGPKARAILQPISFVLGAPELSQAPLDYIGADIRLGNGKIETRNFVVHSAAFLGTSRGAIPIADVLNDSPLSQPVDVALAPNIAKKLRFTDLLLEQSYAKMPAFVRLDGTLGSPDAKTDKAVIAGLAAKGIAGAIGGKTGGILEGVGGLLTGQPSTTTNATPSANSTTNTQSTPLLPVNPFDLLKKKPKK